MTLISVTLVRGGVRHKEETDGDLAGGGAGLAASLLDLIDKFRPGMVPQGVGYVAIEPLTSSV